MNYAQWARQHTKSIIDNLVANSSATPQKQPIAIFAAGIPGAGKTEFLDGLLGDMLIVRIDLDEIVKGFPEYDPRKLL